MSNTPEEGCLPPCRSVPSGALDATHAPHTAAAPSGHAFVSPPTDSRSVDIVSAHRKPAEGQSLLTLTMYISARRSAAGNLAPPVCGVPRRHVRPAIAAHSGHADHPLER